MIATIDCTGNLFTQFKTAFDFILSRLTRSFIVEDAKREEKLEIPKKAIREVLLNALVHRNYHIKGPTKVTIWSDRIEIFSPGSFPGPIDINDLRAGRSYLRNPSICKVFREAGYTEKLGSGFITLLDSYLKAQLSPPKIIDGGDFVKCILPRPKIFQPSGNLESDLLLLFREHLELKTNEIENKLRTSRSTLHRTLNLLIDKGLIERVGQTRSARYKLIEKP